MTAAPVTPERLLPHLEAWLGRAPSRPVFAIHHSGGWSGAEQVTVAGRNVDIRVCPSELAVREELARPREDGRGLVLLTAVETLADDVLARLARPRVHRLLTHEALFGLFGVKAIDPELAKLRWLVDALVDSAPPGGYDRAGAVQLDLARAWRALLVHRYGYDPDAGLNGLLAWAETPAAERLASAADPERAAVIGRIERETIGAGGVLSTVLAGAGRDATALGLIARGLVDGADGPARVAARTRLEVRLQGWALDDSSARAWALAAEERVLSLEDAPRHTIQLRAEQLVADLQADALVHASDVLLVGLRRRLAAFGQAITDRIDGSGSSSVVEQAAEPVARHRAAPDGVAEIIRTAVRLVRWLDRDEEDNADLRSAAIQHAASDAYADWARAALRHGGGEPSLDEALRRLVSAADERRDRQEAAFADHLARWARHAALDDALLGVEHVLARVVAPLARERPLLFVVLDGMSHRVAAELLDDLVRDGWVELRRGDHPGRALVVSALPSVTTYSRASLLSGTLTKGLARDEQQAFAAHPELAAAGTSPRLFHKGELGDPRGGLSAELREEIAGERRVVGAVVNAIDDHLARSDQLRTPWSVRDILPLRWLLDEARAAQRLVVLASDHGHVIEHGSQLRPSPAGSGERWRAAAEVEVGPGEVAVEGTRVLVPGGACLLACSDTVRYATKKNGYHGGASAQEVLAPLMVLSAGLADNVPGWVEVAHDPPAWWLGETTDPLPPAAPAQATATPAPEPGQQLSLDSPKPAATTEAQAPPAWIAELLASDVLTAQRAAAGRTPLPDERVARILQALDAHGGTMLLDGLARVCEIPALRLTGTLAVLRQLLNVDGYPVLEVDDASRDVRLDRALLLRQFGIGGA